MNELKIDEATYNRFSGSIDGTIQRLAAIGSLLEPLRDDCFGLTCAGQFKGGGLGDRTLEKQKEAALSWVNKNYDLVSAAIFAVFLLADDSMLDLEKLSMELYPLGEEIREQRKKRMRENDIQPREDMETWEGYQDLPGKGRS